MKLSRLISATLLGCTALTANLLHASEADIYAVQFSQDGKYLVTGGNGGYTLADGRQHSGGIKVWNSENGALVQAMGLRDDLDSIFGDQYGRVGTRRWGISNFKDVVLTGSWPNGKVVLLPSSLGHIVGGQTVDIPGFVGGYLDFENHHADRIEVKSLATEKGNCDPKTGFHDYIGPIVPSDNGRYAAIVVNTCHAARTADDKGTRFEYRSDLHVMDLNSFKVKRSMDHIDAGVYALGISDDGRRVAFVGRDRFAVLDLDSGKQHLVESYTDGAFMIPRQFSKLQFSRDGSKLVSLRAIYDIDSGTEQKLDWTANDAKKPRRISSVKIAPDLSFFAIVMPKRSLITFGDDGLPRSFGKADKVVLMDTRTGKRTELEITDSLTEGKRCVTDISPDSKRVAVGCKGGLLRVYDARSGELIWKKHNLGRKASDNNLIQAGLDPLDMFLALATD